MPSASDPGARRASTPSTTASPPKVFGTERFAELVDQLEEAIYRSALSSARDIKLLLWLHHQTTLALRVWVREKRAYDGDLPWIAVDLTALSPILGELVPNLSQRIRALYEVGEKAPIIERHADKPLIRFLHPSRWPQSVYDFDAAAQRARREGAGRPKAQPDPHPDAPVRELKFDRNRRPIWTRSRHPSVTDERAWLVIEHFQETTREAWQMRFSEWLDELLVEGWTSAQINETLDDLWASGRDGVRRAPFKYTHTTLLKGGRPATIKSARSGRRPTITGSEAVPDEEPASSSAPERPAAPRSGGRPAYYRRPGGAASSRAGYGESILEAALAKASADDDAAEQPSKNVG